MQKAKKYDWKDSNMALFGSDTEKNVKKSSAETEKAWKGAGNGVGTRIWRIVKFKVTDWPQEDFGKFYDGDSYIILNTYKDEEEIMYDVHFWIGKYSTQDEYGTAAYKTVELDTLLDDKPIQHREVQGHESSLFKTYFDAITIMKGGADTGFRKVVPEKYEPRLLHFCGSRKKVEVKEVARNKDVMKSEDVYIIDNGLTIYQWNGSASNKDEKFTATQYLQKLKSERGGRAKVETLDELDTSPEHPAFACLDQSADDDDDEDDPGAEDTTHELYRLTDESGDMAFDKVKSGSISKSDFDSKDVFIFDAKTDLYVWVGKKASVDERKNALGHAHHYLKNTDHALISVSVINEGQRSKEMDNALAA